MKRDLIILSNRLPLSFEKGEKGLHAKQSSGGLVTALEPLLQEHGGIWVGSAGTEQDPEHQKQMREELSVLARQHHYRYEPITLTLEEQAKFYEGFSNEIIWPLFHDLQSRCNFDPSYWEFYLQVNAKFAECVNKISKRNSLIWINDYQLMQVAPLLRKKLPKATLVFFLHIPFPPPDIYEKLPWGRQVLESLLSHTLIGLQTARDVRNFIACLSAFLPKISVTRAAGGHRMVQFDGRRTVVGAFPISIDFEDFERGSDSDDVRRRASTLRAQQRNDMVTILGIDRLDYTKGIPERLKAFALFLRQHPELHRKTSLIQIVVPSRESIPGYQVLKAEIERLVTQVNGEFAEPGWVPINYIHRALPRTELLALYRTSRVAFITPLKDGMNLVAKEYIACRHENDGVLILSEFAGAATELKVGSLLVNPYDQSAVANALAEAVTMDEAEQRRRMTRLRNQVRKANLATWLETFMAQAEPPHEDAATA
ncbi:trehalose-6-phosphate synthase [Acidipila sp. EB88]|uniref:alpha,alpha-trehalose-phosphate synthase (UDP-forming) n=1 Tax=Acidipila sp. EB88 TaxID=2305226 RepID=UPI000F5E9744|nr:trehalose-6-phosphate synthase [Acidipila sp. EB88]RRA48114.1 trehalose-6-phosphate synthase [Acidipila sp. EB88]